MSETDVDSVDVDKDEIIGDACEDEGESDDGEGDAVDADIDEFPGERLALEGGTVGEGVKEVKGGA